MDKQIIERAIEAAAKADYEVPADLVKPGQRQLLFAWEMAVLIETQSLTSLNEGSAA